MESELLKRSVELVDQRRAEAINYFYSHLFSSHPELRSVFPITCVEEHDRLLTALLHVLRNGHLMTAMVEDLQHIGRDHRKFDIVASHYAAVGESLMATGAAVLGEDWTPAVAAAWRSTYQSAAEIMFRAETLVPRDSRRWWSAQVVKHERRTWDIAVITAQVSESFFYTPGQYVTIETPHWPRLWRPYSIANAPRADGTLEFHVRQIDGGQGSWALVDAVHVGHVLKIGPPSGTLVIDHTRPRDLLLVAGGTGLAPLKALVEDIAAHGGGGRVCLFVGARTEDELYDLHALAELRRRHEWLAVVPVVSDEPGYAGHRGLVVDAVAQYGPWTEFEAYVCGPPAMVEGTRQRLREIGISPRQIHHELWQADLDEAAVAVTTELVPYAGPSTVVYEHHGYVHREPPSAAYAGQPAHQYASGAYADEGHPTTADAATGHAATMHAAEAAQSGGWAARATGAAVIAAPDDPLDPPYGAPDARSDHHSEPTSDTPSGPPNEARADDDAVDADERARRIREMIELKRARRLMYARRR